MVYYLTKKYKLEERFKIGKQQFHAFLRKIETNYGDNPFHNSLHAADVLHVMNYIISTAGLSQYLNEIDIFACILAAACHGIKHFPTLLIPKTTIIQD